MLKKLPLSGYIYCSIALDLVAAVAIILAKSSLPPIVPLFYGKPVGSGQLITTNGLLLAPLAALVITAINIFLASKVDNVFSKKIFSVASFFVSLLTAVTVIKIILLVGFW